LVNKCDGVTNILPENQQMALVLCHDLFNICLCSIPLFIQINILTYVFFMMPSLGIGLEAAGYSNILGHLGHVLGGDNGIFLTTWVWKGSILLFMVSRTAMPIIMAKTDKALLAKIHVIIR
jgi:hypothetical protein